MGFNRIYIMGFHMGFDGYSNVMFTTLIFDSFFIPPIKIAMTGGWFMTLLYQHYRSTTIIFIQSFQYSVLTHIHKLTWPTNANNVKCDPLITNPLDSNDLIHKSSATIHDKMVWYIQYPIHE